MKLLKFKTFNFDLKFLWNWSLFHYQKIMRFKNSPQLPGAGRRRAGHHHGSHTPTSPVVILLSKMACQPKHFGRQCISNRWSQMLKFRQKYSCFLWSLKNWIYWTITYQNWQCEARQLYLCFHCLNRFRVSQKGPILEEVFFYKDHTIGANIIH